MRLALGLVLAALSSACLAQLASRADLAESVAVKSQLPVAAFRVPLGATTLVGAERAASGVALEQRYFASNEEVNVRQVLKGSGVSFDEATLASLKRLNPSLRSDGTLPAGVKFTYFAPEAHPATTLAGSAALHVDMSEAARLTVKTQVSESARIRQEAFRIKAENYDRPADAALHRKLAENIDVTARLVDAQAPTMSARDLALSKFYLQYANVNAQRTIASAAATRISRVNLVALQESVQPLQVMTMRMESHQSPFGEQTVQVSVAPAPGASAPARLRVYVLPVGVLYAGGLVPEDQIRQLLIELTFDQLTSPSVSTLPQAELALWVGPDHAYDAMAKLVGSAGQSIAYKPAKGTGIERLELTFQSPSEVVSP